MKKAKTQKWAKLLLSISSVKPQSEDVKPLRRKFKKLLLKKQKVGSKQKSKFLWLTQDSVPSLVYKSKILWIPPPMNTEQPVLACSSLAINFGKMSSGKNTSAI